MSHASEPFESAVQKANVWLGDVDDRLLSEDRHVAWERPGRGPEGPDPRPERLRRTPWT